MAHASTTTMRIPSIARRNVPLWTNLPHTIGQGNKSSWIVRNACRQNAALRSRSARITRISAAIVTVATRTTCCRAHYHGIVAPVDTLKSISRDPNFQWFLTLRDRSGSNAVSVQWEYLDAVRKTCALDSDDARWTVEEWEKALEDLMVDPLRCRDRLDWPAKHALLTEFQKAQGLNPDDPWLLSLDLEYHRLDLDVGLYFGLEQSGSIQCVPSEATDFLLRPAWCAIPPLPVPGQ